MNDEGYFESGDEYGMRAGVPPTELIEKLKCPICGRYGHLQGITLDGNLFERPREGKCLNGHVWVIEW
jgi:hypothetical protein